MIVVYYANNHVDYSNFFPNTKMFIDDDNQQYIYDPELTYSPKPDFIGFTDSSVYTPVKYDYLGARISENNHDSEYVKKVDILTIGCSQAWGQGIGADSTFSNLLQEKSKLIVKNFAVSGYGGVESLLMLKRHADLNPKIIVYAYWAEHDYRNIDPCSQTRPVCLLKPYIDINDGDIKIKKPKYSQEYKLKMIREWYVDSVKYYNEHNLGFGNRIKWAIRMTIDRIMLPNEYFKSMKRHTSQIKSLGTEYILKQMKHESDLINAKLIILYIPNYIDGVFDAPEYLKKFSIEHDLFLLDAGESIKELKRDNIEYEIPNDRHISAALHVKISEKINKIIVEERIF